MDAIGKVIEKGHSKIDKPLDIADFDKMGKDIDSIIADLKVGREESLYVDYQKGKWISPFDISQEESESWINIAQKLKTEAEPLCNSMVTAPLELARTISDFIDKQLIPSARDQIYRNADELFKNGSITKELYERILSIKKG